MTSDFPIVPSVPTSGCNYCTAEIAWAVTSSGKRMPLDWPAAVNGNVFLTWDPEVKQWRATVETRWERTSEAWQALPKHVHHAVTCPAAHAWSPGMAKSRGAKPDERKDPDPRPHTATPGTARPEQEAMF